MKITHVAFAATILLVGAAVYLLMDARAAKDKEQMQNQIDKIQDQLAEQRKLPPVIPAPVETKGDETPAADTASLGPDRAANPGAAKASPTAKTLAGTPKSTQAAPKSQPSPATDLTQKGVVAAAPGEDVALPNPINDLNLPEAERKLLAAAGAEAEAVPAGARPNKLQNVLRALPAVAKVKSFDTTYGFVVLDAGTNRGLEKGMKFDVRRDAMLVGKIKIGETVAEAECIADVDPKSVPVGVVLQAGDEIVRYE